MSNNQKLLQFNKGEGENLKILILNGSPKGRKGNTFKVAEAFLEGLQSNKKHEVDIIDIYKKKVNDCLGCFNCWTKTPGRCIFKDDMVNILELYKKADMIIWSFPLYYFGIPSRTKAVLDRLLPLNLPFINLSEDNKIGSHPPRYEMPEKKYVLISSCGLPTKESNYEGLKKQFEFTYPNGYIEILCSEGGIINVDQLKNEVNKYLEKVKTAGEEVGKTGLLSEKTKLNLDELIMPKKQYIKLANLNWEVDETQEYSDEDNESSKSLKLMKQMSAIYRFENKKAKDDIIIEFKFIDLGLRYQLVLKTDECEVKTKDFLPYSTQIIIPFSLWEDITVGKISGAQALLNKDYKVKGSLKNMLNMDDYFSMGDKREDKKELKTKKTNMKLLLYPWIMIWIMIGINPKYAGIIGILSSIGILGFFQERFKLTIYDRLTGILVSALGMLLLLKVNFASIMLLSYFLFGLMWSLSCLTKKSLTAHYSGDNSKLDENPIFLKTNKILTLAWGILYLITPIWTYYLITFPATIKYTGLINSMLPFFMMRFTNWFKVWYPKKVMLGN